MSDPGGFDQRRPARLDKHVAAFVDDRRFAGWQLAIARGSCGRWSTAR